MSPRILIDGPLQCQFTHGCLDPSNQLGLEDTPAQHFLQRDPCVNRIQDEPAEVQTCDVLETFLERRHECHICWLCHGPIEEALRHCENDRLVYALSFRTPRSQTTMSIQSVQHHKTNGILVCVRVRLKLLYWQCTRKSNNKISSYIVTSPWNTSAVLQPTACDCRVVEWCHTFSIMLSASSLCGCSQVLLVSLFFFERERK